MLDAKDWSASLTPDQIHECARHSALVTLQQCGRALSVFELADRTGLSKETALHAAEGLVARGQAIFTDLRYSAVMGVTSKRVRA